MRVNSKALMLAGALPLLALVAGCGHKEETKPVATMSEEQVPDAIKGAVDGSNQEVQTQAAQIQEAARQQDPHAVTELIQMIHRPDVTLSQRSELSKCLPPLLAAARKAADAGDPRAAEALKAYNISK